MRVRWFGPPWPSAELRAPVCENDEDRTDTPIGKTCLGCGQPILDGDRGIVMAAGEGIHHSFFWVISSDAARLVCAEHIDCHIREIIPAYAHLVERRLTE